MADKGKKIKMNFEQLLKDFEPDANPQIVFEGGSI
jgi:hypothetical protein